VAPVFLDPVPPPPVPLTLAAPAKINLHLRVLGRRPDGYHDLDSVFHAVGLADEVRLEDAPGDFWLTCSDRSLEGPENLCLKAARALRDHLSARGHPAAGRGARIYLEKRIPPGAGLGGGSSDAAAVLKGLNTLWGLGFPREELAGIGAEVGSDVPFCVYGGAARVEGRGERVTPIPPRTGTWCLLAHPGFPVSTAAVYAAWDRAEGASGAPGLTARAGAPIMGPAPEGAEAEPGSDPGARTPAAPLPPVVAYVNDLEGAACQVAPEIGTALAALRQAGGREARMTGSGSTVFCLAGSRAQLEETRRRLHPPPQWNLWIVPLTAAEGS
jgi:4-diphosphocytidyl-2-C-methyl-D-erythritol kinase